MSVVVHISLFLLCFDVPGLFESVKLEVVQYQKGIL